VIPPELCRLASLQILDLAQNIFSGAIPRCINNFTAMAVKLNSSSPIYYTWDPDFQETTSSFDFRSTSIVGYMENELLMMKGNINHLSGVIPKKIGSMGQLGALDLSRNQLYGEIPPCVSNLTFLSYLDLSFNNLSGRIPSSTQLQGFNASSFVGNKLCGLPLTKNCSVDHGKTTPGAENEGDDTGNGSGVDWFYIFMAIGFARFLGCLWSYILHQVMETCIFSIPG
ncbi:hypothetical protein C3L33_22140, partial [Rhododendron williamsianum]